MTTSTRTTDRRPRQRRRHGLDQVAIKRLLAAQGGGCAICSVPEDDRPGARLAVDHDHTHCPGSTGCPQCVRGLLCVSCNNLLRSARDNVRTLAAAIAYISR